MIFLAGFICGAILGIALHLVIEHEKENQKWQKQ